MSQVKKQKQSKFVFTLTPCINYTNEPDDGDDIDDDSGNVIYDQGGSSWDPY